MEILAMKTLLLICVILILSGDFVYGGQPYSNIRAAAVISYSSLHKTDETPKPEPKPEPDDTGKAVESKPIESKYTAIFFTSKTCGPCQIVKRHIDNNMRKMGWTKELLQIEDIDEPTELSTKYNVTPNSPIPYLIIVHNDKVIDRYLGGDYFVDGKIVDLSAYIKHILRKNKVIE